MNKKVKVIYGSTNEKTLKKAIENVAEATNNKQNKEIESKDRVAT